MSKITIIEGNSNDKDNTRIYMVKGETGDDGISPTIDVSKTDGVTTLTIEDAEGTKTATIADGEDLVGGVPTNGVIGWDSEEEIPDGYEDYTEVEPQNNVAFLAPLSTLQEDFGDCSVILGAKTIIVDLSFETDCATLIGYLQAKNISKIDYVVLSHYHKDHIGGENAEGLTALLNTNGLDFSGCTFLLPHKDINYSSMINASWVNTIEQSIISTLTAKNITYKYPTEAEIITIDDNAEMQFFNVSTSYYSDYYNVTTNAYGEETNATNYNNFSMVMSYKHFDNYFWFTGDIDAEAQENIYQNIKNCDVLKVEHHGLNYNTSKNYLNQLQPKYAVVFNRAYYSTPFDYAQNTVFEVLSKNARLYATRTSNKAIEFVSKQNGVITETETNINLYNMVYSLWEGQLIPENADLNNITNAGIYFSKNATWSNTLSNVPVDDFNSSTKLIDTGFKLIVEHITGAENRIKQTIITGNSNKNAIYYRSTVGGVFTNSEWVCLTPSNIFNINFANDTSMLTIDTNASVTAGHATKRNGILEINMEITIAQQISSYTDFITLPEKFLLLTSSVNTLIMKSDGSSNIIGYWRNNNGKCALRSRVALPAGDYLVSTILVDNT